MRLRIGGDKGVSGSGNDSTKGKKLPEVGPEADSMPSAPGRIQHLKAGFNRWTSGFRDRRSALPQLRSDVDRTNPSIDPSLIKRRFMEDLKHASVEAPPYDLPAGVSPQLVTELVGEIAAMSSNAASVEIPGDILKQQRTRGLEALLRVIGGFAPASQQQPLAALAKEAFDLYPNAFEFRRTVRRLTGDARALGGIDDHGYAQITAGLVSARAREGQFGDEFFDGGRYATTSRDQLRELAKKRESGSISDGIYAELLARLAYSLGSARFGEDNVELHRDLMAEIKQLPRPLQAVVFGCMFTSKIKKQDSVAQQAAFDRAWGGLDDLSDADAKEPLIAVATNVEHLREDSARASASERIFEACEGKRAALADDLAGIALRHVASLKEPEPRADLLDRGRKLICGNPPLNVSPQTLSSRNWSPEERLELFKDMFGVVKSRDDTPQRGVDLAELVSWIEGLPDDAQPGAIKEMHKLMQAAARDNQAEPWLQMRKVLVHSPELEKLLREVGDEILRYYIPERLPK